MSVTVVEQYGRQLSPDRAELIYLIRGTDDPVVALTQLLTESPGSVSGLLRDNRSVEVREIHGLVEGGYLGTVPYVKPEITSSPPLEVGQSQLSFDTGGGTARATVSKSTVGAYGTGVTVGDNGGLIGVTDSGVEGVDYVVPQYTFSETHALSPAMVDNAYRGVLFNLTGKVNDASFRGLPEGSVLFLGASGTQRGDEAWELTYRFTASPNISNATIGSFTGIDKKGWEHLWIRYRSQTNETAGLVTRVPAAVYVERIYDEADFSALGIGT